MGRGRQQSHLKCETRTLLCPTPSPPLEKLNYRFGDLSDRVRMPENCGCSKVKRSPRSLSMAAPNTAHVYGCALEVPESDGVDKLSHGAVEFPPYDSQ
ncbi:uncharacterized protein VTP21DRAFT_7932 [Calcarisporiella thermophila]|uniref:uncharacterized protein n=1 Tax=Calcarisporiella thermophila TaxID=911321 RepID=UPI003743BA65